MAGVMMEINDDNASGQCGSKCEVVVSWTHLEQKVIDNRWDVRKLGIKDASEMFHLEIGRA